MAKKRIQVYGFLVALIAVLAVAFLVQQTYSTADAAEDEKTKNEEKEDPSTPVEVADVKAGDISAYLSATANLRAQREVNIVSQVEGPARQVLVEEGDRVEKGQLLVQLDDRELRIQIQTANQKLAQARLQGEKARTRGAKAETQIRNAQEELDRYQSLYDEKLVSEREVAQLRYRAEELAHDQQVSDFETREFEHRVDELKAEIARVELQIELTRIHAPFAGRITMRGVEVGQTVRPADVMFHLGSFSTLLADVHVSEREARSARIGQAVRVSLASEGTSSLIAKVARISPVVDQSTGTVKVTIELRTSEPGFKPGAFVRVDIETDTRGGSLLIPKRALVEEDGEFYVFVSDQEKAIKTKVDLGYSSDGQTEVRSGLERGQKVVVAGQGSLKDGSKIRVVTG